jgi:sensor histidine kinase regulating citrate/malate metabolism
LAFSQRHAGAGFTFWANVSLCRVGGDVTVTSEPGKGSVFTVRLPGAAT